MTQPTNIDYKQKALDHVRIVCPELMELSFGCRVINEVGVEARVLFSTPSWKKGGLDVRLDDTAIKMHESELQKIIGHTPHLEHWLRGIEHLKGDSYQEACRNTLLKVYNLTKDGKNQSQEFYKAYCEITNCI